MTDTNIKVREHYSAATIIFLPMQCQRPERNATDAGMAIEERG
jgi:hypothetical protein